jgi:hypothetical protein
VDVASVVPLPPLPLPLLLVVLLLVVLPPPPLPVALLLPELLPKVALPLTSLVPRTSETVLVPSSSVPSALPLPTVAQAAAPVLPVSAPDSVLRPRTARPAVDLSASACSPSGQATKPSFVI